MAGNGVDTLGWIKRVLSGAEPAETPEHRAMRLSRPETSTERFIREALGEPAPLVGHSLRARALMVLLQAEQAKRQRAKALPA